MWYAISCLILTGAATLVRFVWVGALRTPENRFFAAVFVVGGSAAVFCSPLAAALARTGWEPVPQLTYLLGAVLSDTAAFCVVSTLLHALSDDAATARRRTRWHAGTLVLCSLTMATLLISMHPSRDVDVRIVYGRDLRIALFQVISSTYIAWAASEFVVTIRRYLRTVQPGRPIRISLRLEITGAALALAYCLWGIARAVTDWAGAQTVLDNRATYDLLSVACFASMVLGTAWIVPGIPALEHAWSRWRRRAARNLQPLHHQLRPVNPDLVLPPVTQPEGNSGAGTATERSLYELLIEIRDLQSKLSPFTHPELHTWTRQLAAKPPGWPFRRPLSPRKTRLLIEATQLACALDAHNAGVQYGQPPGIGLPTAQTSNADGHADQITEARELMTVHTMMRGPLVRKLRARHNKHLNRYLAGQPGTDTSRAGSQR